MQRATSKTSKERILPQIKWFFAASNEWILERLVSGFLQQSIFPKSNERFHNDFINSKQSAFSKKNKENDFKISISIFLSTFFFTFTVENWHENLK